MCLSRAQEAIHIYHLRPTELLWCGVVWCGIGHKELAGHLYQEGCLRSGYRTIGCLMFVLSVELTDMHCCH